MEADGQGVEIDPPMPVRLREGKPGKGKLRISDAFNSAHAEGCECCQPSSSTLEPGFWRKVGFGEQAESQESQNVRLILLSEVEKEAEVMSPIERTGAIYGWKRAGEMAVEEADWEGAGDCYARALAFGAALGEIDGGTPFPAWYPRQEVDKLCSEVLVKVSEMEVAIAAAEGEAWLGQAFAAAIRANQLDPSNPTAEAMLRRLQT
ncbi:unnamed protein product [Durusdinium trenchii]|uniref:KIF-binding protein n=1 Tax=Durusdinium trenchii TaxID=1381693 RepID=A0ABP0KM74_9DINO